MTSKLVKCSCKHAVQDELYGIGNRVGNETRSGQLRCTVCGTILGSAQTFVQKAAPVVKEAIKEVAKETPKRETKKAEPKKEAPKGKIDKKSSDKKGSLKGGKR